MPSRLKEKDRDSDPSKTKERTRHRKPSRSSHKSDKASTPPDRTSSTSALPTTGRRASMPTTESERPSLPYPAFSKAHSKEDVGSKENVANPRGSYYTPDPTDIDQSKIMDKGVDTQPVVGVAPPSPPETMMEQKPRTPKAKVDGVKPERKGTELQKKADEIKKRLVRGFSGTSDMERSGTLISSRSGTSNRESTKAESKPGPPSTKNSKPGTPSKFKPKAATVEDSSSSTSFHKTPSSVQSSGSKSEATASTDSDATSIAPNQPNTLRPFTPRLDRDASSILDQDPEPRTPTLSEPQYPLSRKTTPAYSINGAYGDVGIFEDSPMPPPPPPPPELPMPRVDYLMQNGGLPHAIPRRLLAIGQASPPDQPTPTHSEQVERFFTPFNIVLDNYSKVMAKNGSLAVATGYRSVARRLLDRLEAVFARDISSETCECNLCQCAPDYGQDLDDKRGVSWGEILEYVCGRQELPQWPPFVMESHDLGITTSEQAPPMQKLDIDVPEEFRAHYVRQSFKTKESVDRWLESQFTTPTSPPQDVDDETLTFAMLTRLELDQRPMFKTLLGVGPSRPPSTRGSPLLSPPSDLLPKTGLALQRLYRLTSPPRDPESAMFLLTNLELHNMLATLAGISNGEWEILISGRFDGFLRSGAEDLPNHSALPPSRGPSRGPTPLSRMTTPASIPPSRGPTPFSSSSTYSPASIGAPVTLDEETEIAVLAEMEREIYLSMEAFENALEALHYKAEAVRSTLRERGAGLAQANQRRRGGGSNNLDARMGTPASGFGGWESGTDDGIDDTVSELAPDDSASNISSSRHRRPRRRAERRTPAPVEEVDEEEIMDAKGSRVGSRLGKRR